MYMYITKKEETNLQKLTSKDQTHKI